METLVDRCNRLCGKGSEECFIGNKKQVICIADMVINKASGIKSIIDTAIRTNQYKDLTDVLDEASQDIDDLISWVKFLQIAQDLRRLTATYYENSDAKEMRREKRYLLPEIYQRYIMMEISLSDGLLPVKLIDYSRNGIKFECPVSLDIDSILGCTLVTSHLSSHQVTFKGKIKYCLKNNGNFLLGARIKKVDDETSFNLFNKMHDLIVKIVEKELINVTEE